jgi:hypothetical protein
VRDGHQEFLGKRSGDTTYSGDHGARVAGIAAAVTDNGSGIAGVSWGARVNLQYNSGSVSSVASAIAEGLSASPDVMNHSYRLLTVNGNNIYSPLVHRLFLDAYKLGVVHAVAVGNSYNEGDPYIYPARNGWAWKGYNQGLMVVGGIGEEGLMYGGSSSGPHVDHVAPGFDVVSTTNDNGIIGTGENGTSFSAPHSAGAAALLLSIDPNLDPNDIDAILNLSAIDMLAQGYDNRSGWGRLDIAAAIDSLTMNDFSKVSDTLGNTQIMDLEYWDNAVLEGYPGIPEEEMSIAVMRARKAVTFPRAYREPPHVWGCGNGSTGASYPPWYNIRYTKVVEGSVTETGCTLETYVYRWPSGCPSPCPPYRYIPENFYPFDSVTWSYSILGKPEPDVAVDEEVFDSYRQDLLTLSGPSPFNSTTTFQINLTERDNIRLYICDIGGRRLRQLESGMLDSGTYSYSWNARDDHGRELPSGVYIAIMEKGSDLYRKNVVLTK